MGFLFYDDVNDVRRSTIGVAKYIIYDELLASDHSYPVIITSALTVQKKVTCVKQSVATIK